MKKIHIAGFGLAALGVIAVTAVLAMKLYGYLAAKIAARSGAPDGGTK